MKKRMFFFLWFIHCSAQAADLPGIPAFIDEMVAKHQFKRDELQRVGQGEGAVDQLAGVGHSFLAGCRWIAPSRRRTPRNLGRAANGPAIFTRDKGSVYQPQISAAGSLGVQELVRSFV